MTHEEFSIGMDRLTETYGARNYPKERVNGIWKSVEHLPGYAWGEIIDTLICERSTPPMRNQILEAARPYLDDVQRAEFDKMMDQLRTWEACRWCKYTGLIRAKHTDYDLGRESEAVFRCTYCRASSLRRLSRGILAWGLQVGWSPIYANGDVPDPWDIPNPNQVAMPQPREHEPEPVAQPGRVHAILHGALAGKKIETVPKDHDIDFDQIEIDL